MICRYAGWSFFFLLTTGIILFDWFQMRFFLFPLLSFGSCSEPALIGNLRCAAFLSCLPSACRSALVVEPSYCLRFRPFVFFCFGRLAADFSGLGRREFFPCLAFLNRLPVFGPFDVCFYFFFSFFFLLAPSVSIFFS